MTRWILHLLKSMRLNLLDAFDDARAAIDRDEAHGDDIRQTYARDLSTYIEGPTRRLNRKEPS